MGQTVPLCLCQCDDKENDAEGVEVQVSNATPRWATRISGTPTIANAKAQVVVIEPEDTSEGRSSLQTSGDAADVDKGDVVVAPASISAPEQSPLAPDADRPIPEEFEPSENTAEPKIAPANFDFPAPWVADFVSKLRSEVDGWERSSNAMVLMSQKWRDISNGPAKILYKNVPDPARDCVDTRVLTSDFAPSLPLLETHAGNIKCGILPTTLFGSYWYLWFPFCESGEILRWFSPNCFIVKVKLKILSIALDLVFFVHILDSLDTHGCFDIVMGSPPTGSEGKDWLGITVPPRAGTLPRICIHRLRLMVYPKTPQVFDARLRFEVEDSYGIPQWVKVFAIQQIVVRIVPELAKFQRKIPGSPLDTFLNAGKEGCVDRETKEYMLRFSQRVDQHVKHLR